VTVDVDITGAKRLWLAIEDAGSYDASKLPAGWMDAELTGPRGSIRLRDLPLPAGTAIRSIHNKDGTRDALAGRAPELISYDLSGDLAGKPFTRFRAVAGMDESGMRPEITGKVRFFVFTREPVAGQLVRVSGTAPMPAPPKLSGDALIARLFRHALGREPDALERREAGELLRQGAPGLEDLLWILFLSPEFQLIR
jgi:hypothetical protein